MYETPTNDDFNRQLLVILKRTRDIAFADSQRITVEHAAKGLGQSGPLISAVAIRFDELHADAVDSAMRMIGDFVSRTQLSPAELGNATRGILETIAAELVARVPMVGSGALAQATEQVRTKYRRTFAERLENALRDIQIGFVGGKNMVMPMKDADRRAVILRRFYEERHIRSWVNFPVDSNTSHEEKLIAANICSQLHESGLIEWKTPSRGLPEGMGRITSLGVDVVEGNASASIAISIDKSISVSGSTHVQIGDRNVQDVHMNADKIVAAINQSTATVEEKEEAKSLWEKVIASPLLSKIVGPFIGAGG